MQPAAPRESAPQGTRSAVTAGENAPLASVALEYVYRDYANHKTRCLALFPTHLNAGELRAAEGLLFSGICRDNGRGPACRGFVPEDVGLPRIAPLFDFENDGDAGTCFHEIAAIHEAAPCEISDTGAVRPACTFEEFAAAFLARSGHWNAYNPEFECYTGDGWRKPSEREVRRFFAQI